MSGHLQTCVLTLFLLIWATPGLADLAIVTARDSAIETLDRDVAEQLYLGRLNALRDGTSVRLLDLPQGPERDRFYQRLIGKNPLQTRAYWSRMVFSGRVRPPRELRTPTAVREALQQDAHLIGYLPEAEITPELRILLTVD
ncbi:MAG: hypothetical protein RBT55_05830 [Rhodocyclaceae bacterium]|jgi:hypothetical protein|nr:hypothetical protein [Rhodocyclaceae bacterium]